MNERLVMKKVGANIGLDRLGHRLTVHLRERPGRDGADEDDRHRLVEISILQRLFTEDLLLSAGSRSL